MTFKNDLRIWAVYDNLSNRIEFMSQSRSECDRIFHLYKNRGLIRFLEVLRFDLCPLYRNVDHRHLHINH